jgi:hypothetical protein
VSGLASKPLGAVSHQFGPQNRWRRFGLKTTRTVFTGLALKLATTVSSGLTSKPAMTVSGGFASKPAATVFTGLVSKPVATVFSNLASKSLIGFLVEPQNQGGGGFPGLDLKTGSFALVIWTSKSLRRFLDLGLKTK